MQQDPLHKSTVEVSGELSSPLPPLEGTLPPVHSPKDLLVHALRGHQVTAIESYQVYTDFSKPSETVVFVCEGRDEVSHKYIFAHTADRLYIVAAPTRWLYSHRQILEVVRAASGQFASCPGGGFVVITGKGTIFCSGESGEFGMGDHVRAKAALERAVRGFAKTET